MRYAAVASRSRSSGSSGASRSAADSSANASVHARRPKHSRPRASASAVVTPLPPTTRRARGPHEARPAEPRCRPTREHPTPAASLLAHNTCIKRLNHPAVGQLDLTFNRLDLTADPGQTLLTYTAEPGTPSEDALKL